MISAEELASALRAAGVGEVRCDSTTRVAYSADSSLYRVTPLAVARPRDGAEVAAALQVCRQAGVALTARGGGTSVAGNAIGPGLLLDFGRHLNRVLEIDPDARTAVVEPGVIPAVLQQALTPYGLHFGPDPSTHTRCTIGGMIGNNACGTRSVGYGRTSDNVVGLDVITGTGAALSLAGPGDPAAPELAAVHRTVTAGLATIRTELGRLRRQISGYALEHLLPEYGFDVATMLVGSEGSLAVTTRATVRLVTEPAHRVLVVLGYPDIVAAADAAPAVLQFGPTACEGIDYRIVDVVRARKGPQAVPTLPRGTAWLFVELAADEPIDPAQARQLGSQCAALDALVVTDPGHAARLWRIRADGAGLSARTPAGRPAHAGWEDAAVPPARLGAYLRDFDALLVDHDLTAAPYGHFGDGCLHARIDFPFERSDGAAVFREFLLAAATMVAGYGGSLSGEHGDGRARGELLPLMYSPAALRLFADIKHAFDPDNVLNPGIIVDPPPVDVDLRPVAARPLRTGLALAYRADDGDFTRAVHRCTGVGSCRADNTGAGGVMCPSYLATREEQDSTRGRARVLQELITIGRPGGGADWRAPEVHEALELCLSCKGCASDCPTGVDMAAYKSEVLYQAYRGRIRPRAHYALGQLPRWARLAAVAPGLVNTATRVPGIGRLALTLAGVDHRRTLPQWAKPTFRAWFEATRAERRRDGEPVLLFVDTFTNYFTPDVGRATVAVLEAAGFHPRLTPTQQCCGLTWITTGQLDAAKKILGATVTALAEAGAGVPIVGIEPSCTAVLRSDARELLDSRAAESVAATTRTLAELLTEREVSVFDLTGSDLTGLTVVAQPHCHHHAVLGWQTDADLLTRAGAQLRQLGGCCGLAGNFGVEKGHYDISMRIASRELVPAVAGASADAVILADGYSCRTQISDLTDRVGVHLAQLLAGRGV